MKISNVERPAVALPETSNTAPSHSRQTQNPSDVDHLRASLGADVMPHYVDRQADDAAQLVARRWSRLISYADARTHLTTISWLDATA